MSDKKYDSVLVGYAEEPVYYEGKRTHVWNVRFKDHELKEMIDKYATSRNEEGQGGNIYITFFMSKNGKPCIRVFDPNSELRRRNAQRRRRRSHRRRMTSLLIRQLSIT